MADLETDLHNLHQKIEDATGRHAQAALQASAAKTDLAAAVKRLHDEYGIATPEAGATALAALETQAAAEVRIIEEALAVVEGRQ